MVLDCDYAWDYAFDCDANADADANPNPFKSTKEIDKFLFFLFIFPKKTDPY